MSGEITTHARAETPKRAAFASVSKTLHSASGVKLELLLLFILAGGFIGTAVVPAWRHLNSDFPNYYLIARLYREGYALDRVYDWTWLQREKDHKAIDQGLVGFVPSTLPSAIVVEPLTFLPPLAAKRCWIIANGIFLILTGLLLTRMTALSGRRVAIIISLAFVALRSNFLLGQMHLLVLLLLTCAAWLFFRRWHFLSGFTLALAAALKVYPALFLLFFILKRRWRAASGLVVGLLGSALVSLYLFGFDACLVYGREVLPAALRGETIDPYNVAWGSLTTLLRRLFIFEPELNPVPVAHLPWLYAFLQPAIHSLVLVLFMWAIGSPRDGELQEKRDWAVYLFLLLFLSSQPAGYHFVALILSAALIVNEMVVRNKEQWARALLVIYALICTATFRLPSAAANGWYTLAFFPRLWLMSMFGVILLLWMVWEPTRSLRRYVSLRSIGISLAVWSVLSVGGFLSTKRHLSGEFENYNHRVLSTKASLFAAYPSVTLNGTVASVMTRGGYTIREETSGAVAEIGRPDGDWFHPVRSQSGWIWAEHASRNGSRIVRLTGPGPAAAGSESTAEIMDAEQPVLSSDGKLLAFFRAKQGRNSLWSKSTEPSSVGAREVVGPEYDPRDAAFLPDSTLIFSSKRNGAYALYRASLPHKVEKLQKPVCSARYPGISPDGRWLAFSCAENGNWQLHAIELDGTEELRLTHGECNSITPAWTPDSKSLIYATDCGRGLGLTALAEIRVLP